MNKQTPCIKKTWISMLWIANEDNEIIVLTSTVKDYINRLPSTTKTDMEDSPAETVTRLAHDALGLRLNPSMFELICSGLDQSKNDVHLFAPDTCLSEVNELFSDPPSEYDYDFTPLNKLRGNKSELLTSQREYLIRVAKLVHPLGIVSDNSTPVDHLKDKTRGHSPRPL